MNRRGILKLLSLGAGSVASAPVMGTGAIASALGLDMSTNAPMPVDQLADCHPSTSDFWGSPMSIAIDAKHGARHQVSQGERYAHMRSWGAAFRQSVVEREIQAEMLFRQKLMDDEGFRSTVMKLMGISE